MFTEGSGFGAGTVAVGSPAWVSVCCVCVVVEVVSSSSSPPESRRNATTATTIAAAISPMRWPRSIGGALFQTGYERWQSGQVPCSVTSWACTAYSVRRLRRTMARSSPSSANAVVAPQSSQTRW